MQTLIRLLKVEQSDQGLHCLHFLGCIILTVKPPGSNLGVNTALGRNLFADKHPVLYIYIRKRLYWGWFEIVIVFV